MAVPLVSRIHCEPVKCNTGVIAISLVYVYVFDAIGSGASMYFIKRSNLLYLCFFLFLRLNAKTYGQINFIIILKVSDVEYVMVLICSISYFKTHFDK